jgi:hypothetical protein
MKCSKSWDAATVRWSLPVDPFVGIEVMSADAYAKPAQP